MSQKCAYIVDELKEPVENENRRIERELKSFAKKWDNSVPIKMYPVMVSFNVH